MQSETNLSQQAEALIATRYSLNELLGEGWLEKSTFNSLEEALGNIGIKDLDDGETVIPREAATKMQRHVADINAVFHANRSDYQARIVTDESGKERLFITGNIGQDRFYQEVFDCYLYKDDTGKKGVTWFTSKFGLIAEDGKVFSFDKAFEHDKHDGELGSFGFVELVGSKYKSDMFVSNVPRSSSTGTVLFDQDTLTQMPHDFGELGAFLHELGHLLRFRNIVRHPELVDAAMTATEAISIIEERKNPYQTETGLTGYQVRKITEKDERGAWAAGLAMIREAGKKIGLQSGSQEAVQEMMGLAERSLSTYDNTPYTFLDHDNGKPIPAFSNGERRNARELHGLMKKGEKNYSGLMSFDPHTGENIANSPKRILDRLSSLANPKKNN